MSRVVCMLLPMAVLFVTCEAAPGEVYLWSSAMISQWTDRASLDRYCDLEFSGGFALVCTLRKNVSEYFDENSNVLTRDTSGQGWNSVNYVANAGKVRSQMFQEGGLLGVEIRTIQGLQTGDDGISTGCDPRGGIIPAFSCGESSYSSPGDFHSSNGRAALDYHWLISNSGVSCTAPWRVYCLQIPTPFPTPLPSSSPTPRPTPLPTPLPTSFPTPSPTYSPTTLAPTVPGGTRSPVTNRPSRAPTRMPTPLPSTLAPTTTRPTNAPTPACATCTATLFPSLNNTNTSFNLGPDLSNAVVIHVPPRSIPNCTTVKCSVILIVSPVPPTPVPAAGESILSIDVYDGSVPRDNVSLNIPITFLMPFSASLAGCEGEKHTECVWRDRTEWANSGCVSEQTEGGTLCTCTHLTDFAVLLDMSFPHPCSPSLHVPEIYYVFIILYALVFFYCVSVFCALMKSRTQKETHNAMLLQHFLIASVSVLRMLSCLTSLSVFGEDKVDTLVLTAFVAAAPYPLEYFLFTKFASTWVSLVHYAMMSADARWIKIRPFFYILNVCGSGAAIALFILFVLQSSYESALAGTCILAALYLALAIVFNVYATKILNELAKGMSNSGNNSSSSKKAANSVANKIWWVGRGAAVCFVAQALCSILALVCPSSQLAGWTAAFLLFNVLALVCVLAAYFAAVKKAIFKTDTSLMSDRDLSNKSGSHLTSQGSTVSGSELREIRNKEAGS